MKEVISIPAGQTQSMIKRYYIHAHPHPRRYKEAQYITLRAKGGIMDALYRVQSELVLKPEQPGLELKLNKYSENVKERLLGYIDERKSSFGFGEKEEYKFYVLEEERPLNHHPRPKGGNLQTHTYYTLDEITSGVKEVRSESQLKRLI